MNKVKEMVSSAISSFQKRPLIQKILVLIVIIVIGWFVKNKFLNGKDAPTYQFESVEKGNITQIVSETGQIQTTNKIEVTTTIVGVVENVYVKNGDEVKRGQKLFEVTSTATEAERSQALSSYQSAKAGVEQAEASKFSLQSKMFTQWGDYINKTNDDTYADTNSEFRNLPEFQSIEKDWLAAEADYKAQDEVLAKNKASLNKAWLDYQATLSGPVKATADGVVANLSIAKGQVVSATDKAMVLSTDSETWIKVGVNEGEILQVKPEQKATVTIDAIENKKFDATVQRVDNFGTDVSGVTLYYVYLALNNPDDFILPGMSGQVDIITEQKSNVLTVSSSAIKPYQSEKAVQILNESGEILYKPVKVGVNDDLKTEILSGVEEGERIIVNSSAITTNSSSGGSNRAVIFGAR